MSVIIGSKSAGGLDREYSFRRIEIYVFFYPAAPLPRVMINDNESKNIIIMNILMQFFSVLLTSSHRLETCHLTR